MTLDRSRTDDRAVMMVTEPRSSSVPADTLDAIALLQASGAGSGIPFNLGRKSFQNAQDVVRGPLPRPTFLASRMKYWGWSLEYGGHSDSVVVGFLENKRSRFLKWSEVDSLRVGLLRIFEYSKYSNTSRIRI